MPVDAERPATAGSQVDGAVTIYEVAARAGVSIATVSHAFNRPDRVAEDTRRRVLESADELGFVARGRGPSRKAARRVGVVAPFSLHNSYLRRLLGVLRAASGDYDVAVIDDSPEGGAPLLERLPLRGRIDGLIIMGAEPSERLAARLANDGVRTVLLDRPSDEFTSVVVDDEAGGRLVAQHLADTGARRIAWISPPPPAGRFITSGELRLRGFTEQLRRVGITREAEWVVVEDTFEGARDAALELPDDELPDAVFALHDTLAGGFISGLRARGLRVPEDVRVVGYDDGEAAALMDLTSVRQPFEESGFAALEALERLFTASDRPIAHVNLRPQLVVRGSSGPGLRRGEPG